MTAHDGSEDVLRARLSAVHGRWRQVTALRGLGRSLVVFIVLLVAGCAVDRWLSPSFVGNGQAPVKAHTVQKRGREAAAQHRRKGSLGGRTWVVR